MARKKVSKKIPKPIKWNAENEALLKEAVQDFNTRVKSLRKRRKDKSFIPSTVSVRKAKKEISTEKELRDVIRSLGRFKGSKAYKKVTLESGESLTNWEYKELLKERKIAKQRLEQRLKELRRPVSKMGSEERAKVKSALKSIKNFEKLTGADFDIARERISRYGMADYEMKQAIQYKKNYLKMLKEEYFDFPNYKKLRKIIVNTNPMKFYNDLKLMELNDYLIDITYMYDTSNQEELFETLTSYYLEEGE